MLDTYKGYTMTTYYVKVEATLYGE